MAESKRFVCFKSRQKRNAGNEVEKIVSGVGDGGGKIERRGGSNAICLQLDFRSKMNQVSDTQNSLL